MYSRACSALGERFEPSPLQEDIRNAPEQSLVIIAPAGCGKTEALALRVAGLIEREVVRPPQRILLATFTNRSRENIAERVAHHVSRTVVARTVTVQNLHGLSARIVRAHGNVVGLDSDWDPPRADWVLNQCRQRKLSRAQTDLVQQHLQQAKLATRTDAEVADYLAQTGHSAAQEIEQQRIAEHLLTYDDLPRLADLVLRNDLVADLYQHHFGYVIVDEFQDLTAQQASILNRIASGRITFAGDPAQGIYSFTGAQPESVLAAATAASDRVITFAESHRSSPAVLEAVNALAPLTGGTTLECSRPETWFGGGLAAHVEHADYAEEASWVISLSSRILARAPKQRIGVLVRAKGRRSVLENALASVTAFPWHRWDDPIFDSHVGPLLKSAVRRTTESELLASENIERLLLSLVSPNELQDPGTREALVDAANWVDDLVRAGETVKSIAARIKAGETDTLLTAPGVHLLTGHAGKGQQFDWVLVLGLEQGSIPFYRAVSQDAKREEARVLAVMLSRARHGVFTSQSLTESKPWEPHPMRARPSEFLPTLLGTNAFSDWETARTWLNSADWAAIRSR